VQIVTTIVNLIWRYRLWLVIATILALAALLALSPSEATLGSVVKLVYLHGALERVAAWAFAAAGLAGAAQLLARRPAIAPWTQALCATAILFWLAHFAVSIPAQVLAWGGINWREPRVVDAMWIAALSAIIYVVALWIARPAWWALSGIASAATLLLVLNGAVNVLHPLSPILTSDSAAIKVFYGGIVLAALLLALVVTVDLAHYNRLRAAVSVPHEEAAAS
jgi:hypothetical protein